jgi:hypothetical protein
LTSAGEGLKWRAAEPAMMKVAWVGLWPKKTGWTVQEAKPQSEIGPDTRFFLTASGETVIRVYSLESIVYCPESKLRVVDIVELGIRF